ncbi:inter-alpha-trypsin inhibitor heavy chain H3-like isoform X2 [Pseudophryne corroboree]|uniref:inter-alpha-trypsin inhibitor heavy chain H3-like isoform X2 n=1 Tax=Pseudophryne corroboree TaxID=495146 RepID=UPI003081B835
MAAIRCLCVTAAAVFLTLCTPRCQGAEEDRAMEIHTMDIDCKITSRFARTFITTEIRNPRNSSHEAVFAVELPKTAFITNFSMTVDGVTTVGVVKKKAEADEQYRGALSRGESAGLVQSTGRKMEHFKISVNVGALATAVFKLTYEELLKRHHGIYELQLKVRPQQLVENFQITVDITEPQEISFVKAFGKFITNELTETVDVNHTHNKAHIVFRPTVDQQRKCHDCVETLLDGDFVVKYDVKRQTSAGNIQIVNGYFVHYFAPASLQKVPKNVIFVIDCSGSTKGRKIQQTFEAFTKILEDLPEEDHIGILKFNGEVVKWKNNLVKAVPDNIKSAKEFVAQISARGSTNINSALLSAAEMLKVGRDNKLLPEISTSIIIFLSDRDPTEGVTNIETIMRNVKQEVNGQATLYSLGFGSDVDYNFLEKMSLENGGFARRIYEDSDSALQLQNFYKEVAFPVLLDVSLQYPDFSISALTQNNFRHYYQGSEIIVAGYLENNDVDILTGQVTAQGVSEPFSMEVVTHIHGQEHMAKEQSYIFGDFTERLWAYLTIEQLLSKQVSAEGEEKNNITEEALSLCLKYNFVTPLTSMVITSPEDRDDKKKIVANKPKEDDMDDDYEYAQGRSLFPIRPSKKLMTYRCTYPRRKPGVSLDHPSTAMKSIILRPTDCKDAHVLITPQSVPEKMCIRINEKPNTIIQLLHSSDKGVTLNGRLAADNSSLDKLGIVLKKKMILVEITTKNITVTTGQESEVYSWASPLQGTRFMKREGKRLMVYLDSRFWAIISLARNPDRLALHLENKRRDLNYTEGLLGQLISDDKLRIETDQIIVNGKTLPAENICDLTSHGGKQQLPCVSVAVKADDFPGGNSIIVSDIFYVPHK